MNIRVWIGAALASAAISLPATAQVKDPFDRLEAINPVVWVKGIIREDDVSLLFQHLRESMAASARGEELREPRESEAMKRRSEEIQREIAVRGRVLAGVLLTVFESAAKQMIREALSDFSPGATQPRSAPFVPRSGAGY